MLIEEALPTHFMARYSLDHLSELIARQPQSDDDLLDFVRGSLTGTCGNLYRHARITADRLPIPDIRLPDVAGAPLLDVGCNWGRWCVSAARRGYRVVGIDPSLPAVLAARRVAARSGCAVHVIVGDGRHLPFRDGTFDVVFSYSVLQHFSPEDLRSCLADIRRVLVPGGQALVQMPNRFGLRNLLQQVRRGLRQARQFEVRYWRPSHLQRVFEHGIGPSTLETDGFFTLNAQRSDLDLLPMGAGLVVRLSEWLRAGSERLPWLRSLADSLYVRSSKVS
ncbi:MAG: class I SAM-dependent methyltransferase [Acidobacteriota bacterium]|nr:class I SAM-dependent methyltransferase [Acidobacteriota bacterium]